MAIQPIQQFSYTSGKNATAREDGWTTLSALRSQINRCHPSFDPLSIEVV